MTNYKARLDTATLEATANYDNLLSRYRASLKARQAHAERIEQLQIDLQSAQENSEAIETMHSDLIEQIANEKTRLQGIVPDFENVDSALKSTLGIEV